MSFDDDDEMERVDPIRMVFVHIDMAPSLIDMRPGASTTGKRGCHKPDPLIIATRRFSTFITVTLRITVTGPWSMTDRTEVSRVSDIVLHTGRARTRILISQRSARAGTRVTGCHRRNCTANRGLFRCQHHCDAEEE